jgi:peptidoglycan/xylan/chitin deacetylase (PgdA/CDA1 family)
VLIKAVCSKTDEILDRCSVAKIDLLTNTFKFMLPRGHWGGAGSQPSVFLTFDDGPDPHCTPHLLELLESEQVKATFFLIGRKAAKYPELVKRIHDAGHQIGNHSYNHLLMAGLPARILEREIDETNKAIADAIGHEPRLFRPPYGLMDKRAGRCLEEREITPVYWSSAPEDWLRPGHMRVVRRVMHKLTDGALLVLHEGSGLGKQTLMAVKDIVAACKHRNLGFSRVEH